MLTKVTPATGELFPKLSIKVFEMSIPSEEIQAETLSRKK